jgi:hypothetical protein
LIFFKLRTANWAASLVVDVAVAGTVAALAAKLWLVHIRALNSPREAGQVAPSSRTPIFAAEAKVAAAHAITKYLVTQPLRASDYFHRWRFKGLAGAFPVNLELQREVDCVLRQAEFRRTFPRSPPLFFRSPYGWDVRQRTAPNVQDHWEYEHHVDQFLATCAEIRVPLGLPVESDVGSLTVGELLDASRRSFDASQEVCWSLVAFCGYLPDEPQWDNRFGEKCSYEAMAEAILALPLDSGSCGGTHKQFALAFLLRHASPSSISADLRRRCKDYLLQSSRLLESSQLPNGAWSPLWANGRPSARDDHDAGPIRGDDLVRITGHQLEWIEIVPTSLRPSSVCISRALQFLIDALKRSDSTTIRRDYCAYSHAACVLQRALLTDRAAILAEIARNSDERTEIVSGPDIATPSRVR